MCRRRSFILPIILFSAIAVAQDDYLLLTQPQEPARQWTLGSVVAENATNPGFSASFVLGLQSGIETGFAWIIPDVPDYAACFRGLHRDALHRLLVADAAREPSLLVREWLIRTGTIYCVELDE